MTTKNKKMSDDELGIITWIIAWIIAMGIVLLFILAVARAVVIQDAKISEYDYCNKIYGNQSRFESSYDFGKSCKLPIQETRTYEYHYFTDEDLEEFKESCTETPKYVDILNWKYPVC